VTIRPIFVLSFSVLVACQDVEGTTEPHVFHEGIGERIPDDVAQRWLAQHRSSPSRDLEDVVAQRVSARQLASLASAMPEHVGMALHHAVDDEGARHVLLTAVGEDVDAWESPVVIDASIDAIVDVETARAWVARHAEGSPDHVRYHFYGREMFDEIMAGPSFVQLDVTPALDDESRAQLVLMARGGDGDASARPRSGDPTPYDNGLLCPPTCPGTD
jgi:hypothetical protein